MRRRRGEMGLSQRQLAEDLADLGLKIDPSAVTRLERGTRPVKMEEAVLIAEALDRTVGDLLGETHLEPDEELAELREFADMAMNRATREIELFLGYLMKAQLHLVEHPELLPALGLETTSDDQFGGREEVSLPAPTKPEEYLTWVQRRLKGLSHRAIRVPSEEAGSDLRFIAATLAGLFDYLDDDAWEERVASLDAETNADGEGDLGGQ